MARRPVDRRGTMFARLLVALREHTPPAEGYPEVYPPIIEWIADGYTPDAIQSARARIGDYHLFVVEMRDAFMKTVPGHVPTISWAIFADPEHDVGLVGSCAPSFEDAKLRAEVALRTYLRIPHN